MPRRMFRVAVAVAVFLVALVAKPTGQSPTPPLTNADVIKMVAAQLGDPVTIAAIENARRRTFDLSVDGLIGLKKGGVPDAVIIAMLRTAALDTPQAVAEQPRPEPERGPVPSARPVPPPASALLPRIRPQEPNALSGVFRVNPATGDLIPLEPANAQIPIFGFQSVYLEGATSPITFKYGEPHVFALRSFETFDKLRNSSRDRLRYEIEHLTVRNGKRYATKEYVLLDVEIYGQPKYGLMRGKLHLPAQSYLFTPRTPLEPGQYAFTRGGMLDGSTYGTFGILDR